MCHARTSRAALLRELAATLTKLAELEEAAPPPERATIYTTAPGGPLPPGRSRRWLREHAGEMGGTRTGGKRGRGVVWTVTREQYEAWLAARAQRAPQQVAAPPPPAPVIDLDAWIAASGYRATKRSA